MAKTPQFLKPRLRLFLSADIIGSTALKQTPRDALSASTVEWFPVLQGFYLETQRAFLGGWIRSLPEDTKERQLHWGPDPEFWKVIGDEILFTKELTDSHQLMNVLACWINAIDAARESIRKVDRRLDIKCTAWTAGFPLMNKEVALPRNFNIADAPVTDYFKEGGRLLNERYAKKANDAKIAVDYIGPSIDIGFRLCQFASARKFILSVGVAYILSQSNRKASDVRVTRFRYDGASVLKGVFGGIHYPILWIDLAKPGDLALLEDKLTKPIECTSDDVHKYCDKFFDDASPYTFKPFIISQTENDLKEKPDNYEKDIENIKKNYGLEIIGDKASEKAAEAETPPQGTHAVAQTPALKASAATEETPLAISAINFAELFNEIRKVTKERASPSATKKVSDCGENTTPEGKDEKDENRDKD